MGKGSKSPWQIDHRGQGQEQKRPEKQMGTSALTLWVRETLASKGEYFLDKTGIISRLNWFNPILTVLVLEHSKYLSHLIANTEEEQRYCNYSNHCRKGMHLSLSKIVTLIRSILVSWMYPDIRVNLGTLPINTILLFCSILFTMIYINKESLDRKKHSNPLWLTPFLTLLYYRW